MFGICIAPEKKIKHLQHRNKDSGIRAEKVLERNKKKIKNYP